MSEEKIGMYTAEEILEFMTDGEGRGFMGRSMFDAMYFQIKDLQQKVEQLEKEKYPFYNDDIRDLIVERDGFYEQVQELEKKVEQLENIRKEAIQLINERAYWAEETEDGDFISGKCLTDDDIDDLLNILNKGSDKE